MGNHNGEEAPNNDAASRRIGAHKELAPARISASKEMALRRISAYKEVAPRPISAQKEETARRSSARQGGMAGHQEQPRVQGRASAVSNIHHWSRRVGVYRAWIEGEAYRTIPASSVLEQIDCPSARRAPTASAELNSFGTFNRHERPCYGQHPWTPTRAVSVWYRTAGLASRNQKDLALDIIEAEIRSAQHEVLL